MKRERNADSDSFDMLLDAMCNTFGGIVFIALLIALLSNASSSFTESAPAPPTPKIPEWLTVCEECKNIVILIGQAGKEIADLGIKKENLGDQTKDMDQGIIKGNATIDDLMKKIKDLENSDSNSMPMLQGTTKKGVFLAIHNGNLFSVNNINQKYHENQERGYDLSDVSVKKILNIDIISLRKGQPVTEKALQKDGKIKKILSNINPSKEYVDIMVSKNSFAEFIKIKKEIINKKHIAYKWAILPDNGVFSIHHVKDYTPTVQ